MVDEVQLEVRDDGYTELVFGNTADRAIAAKVPGLRPFRKKAKQDRLWTWWPFIVDVRKALGVRVKSWKADDVSKRRLYTLMVKRQSLLSFKEGRVAYDDQGFWSSAFREPYKVWKHQVIAATFMAEARRVLLADDVGLGKTLSAVAALLRLRRTEDCKMSMIVVTSASAKWQWRTEVRAMVNPEYLDLRHRVVVIDGSPKLRAEQWATPRAILYVVNYELILKDDEIIGKLLADGKVKVVCLDEGSRIKNRGTKISQVLRKLVQKHDVPYRFILNATPLENRLEELWALFDFLRPETFINFASFRGLHLEEAMHCLCWRCSRPYPQTEGACPTCKATPRRRMRRFPKVVGVKNVPQLKQRISSVSLRRRAKDLGWETPTVNSVLYWIDLDKEQRAVYTAMKKAPGNPLGKMVRARMITLAATMDPTLMPSPKTRELIRLLTEEMADEKVLVFTESRQYIDLLVSQLGRAGIEGVSWIHGGVSTKAREQVRESLNEGQTRVLLLDAAGEHALNLQAAPVVINLDLPWNPARLQQRVGRVRPYLGGKDRLIRVVNILARDTVEERVVAAVEKKLGLFSRVWGEHETDLTGTFSAESMEAML